MPNKTIYVREEDVSVFERAAMLFGKSLSRVIAEALRKLVTKAEAKQGKLNVK